VTGVNMTSRTAARVVVVGGDAAGMSAAHQALRAARRRGRELDVVVLESTGHTSYSACGIPYWIAGEVGDSDDLVARTADEHRRMGVDLRLGATATRLDLGRRQVHYRDDAGADARLEFDELVLATGAPAVIPDWARDPGGGLVSGVHPVKDLDDGATWLGLLGHGPAGHGAPGHGARRAVVVGGGYIGVEMAEAMLRRGLQTALVTRSAVMSGLDPDMSGRVSAVLAGAGVEIVTGTEVGALTRGPAGAVTASSRPAAGPTRLTWSCSASGSARPPSSVPRPGSRSGRPAATGLTRAGGSATACGRPATAARPSTG
jgi:NADPH-dependent 2,4-dienoyl-CoA reductase/sulfur reductase-like enzyme